MIRRTQTTIKRSIRIWVVVALSIFASSFPDLKELKKYILLNILIGSFDKQE
jgi:hypothetical protein